jgi:putative oxidoreductase
MDKAMMGKVILGARITLGLIFFVFGLNGILLFFKGPLPPGDAGTFLTIMMEHGYTDVVAVLQLIAGLLLLVGRYVPLALVILAPILVNILLFHLLIMHGGIWMGLLATVLLLFLIWAYRLSFRGLLDAAPEVS